MNFRKLFFTVLFAWLALVSNSHAQTTVGTVYGSVADSSGAKIPGATVTLTDTKTKLTQSAIADKHGDYTFTAVNPSDYIASVSYAGFKSETQTGVRVDANQNVNVSFSLTAGNVSENVEVEAGTTLVDTRESQIGETIDEKRIEELPVINRDPYELLQTVTGVSNYTGDTVIGSRGGANFSVNGFPANTSSFYLDGAQNNVLKSGGGNKSPNPSALQEFRILTSNFDAEFGRSPGAVANLITKSGTAKYHGQIYEFIRNNAFDAKPYFADPGTIINFKQHQFGGAFGGPVPKMSKSTFFFTSYEHLQLHQNAYIFGPNITAPTVAMSTGDFRGLTGITLPNNCGNPTGVICAADLDPVAVNVMKFVPKADPITGNSPTQVARADNGYDQGLMRVDYNGIAHHSAELTYFQNRGSDVNPKAGGNQVLNYSGMYEDENLRNIIAADNWILSSAAVNTMRAFYTYNRFIIRNEYNRSLQDLGSMAPPGGPVAAPPKFNLGNGILSIGPGFAGPSDITQASYGIVDVLNLVKGRHSMKIGGSYIWSKYTEDGGNAAGGTFNVSTTTGSSYADFLLGKASGFTQTNSSRQRKHNYDPSLFVQDNYHVLRRLTLNLGVRWEVYPPFQGDGNGGTFRAGVQSQRIPTAPIGILFEGDPGVAPGISNTSYMRFAPRFGFAYDVYGDGKTSLRGGYGIFYYQQIEDDQGLRIQQPFGLNITTNQPPSYANPYGGPSPFPYVVDTVHPRFVSNATVYATPANGGVNPYAEEFNLSVQQQFGKAFALQVSYVGSNFMRQTINLDINTPVLPPTPVGSGGVATSVISRRPYEPYGPHAPFLFGIINDLQNANNLHYNSLQVTLRGRLGRTIDINSSYVWSKALDFENPVDQTNLRSGYGAAPTDLRHRFVLSLLAGLPTTKHFGAFGRVVLNGWRLNDITILQSGLPFTMTSGTDSNSDGVNSDYPDITGSPYGRATDRQSRISNYINVAAFSLPKTYYGNEQRNSLYLPATTNTNVSLFKEFPLPRGTSLQIRAEAFNVIGNVNFISPRTVFGVISTGSTTQGFRQLQDTQPPRRLQFGARLFF